MSFAVVVILVDVFDLVGVVLLTAVVVSVGMLNVVAVVLLLVAITLLVVAIVSIDVVAVVICCVVEVTAGGETSRAERAGLVSSLAHAVKLKNNVDTAKAAIFLENIIALLFVCDWLRLSKMGGRLVKISDSRCISCKALAPF